MDEALFAVELTEETLSAANARAVLGIVGRLLVRQDVSQRSIRRQVETADLVVDLADGAELPGDVHVRLNVDRLEPFRKAARLGGAIILLNMLARAGNGQKVEQFEIVKPEHV